MSQLIVSRLPYRTSRNQPSRHAPIESALRWYRLLHMWDLRQGLCQKRVLLLVVVHPIDLLVCLLLMSPLI